MLLFTNVLFVVRLSWLCGNGLLFHFLFPATWSNGDTSTRTKYHLIFNYVDFYRNNFSFPFPFLYYFLFLFNMVISARHFIVFFLLLMYFLHLKGVAWRRFVGCQTEERNPQLSLNHLKLFNFFDSVAMERFLPFLRFANLIKWNPKIGSVSG